MGQFLPTTKEEMLERGWSQPDFVYISVMPMLITHLLVHLLLQKL